MVANKKKIQTNKQYKQHTINTHVHYVQLQNVLLNNGPLLCGFNVPIKALIWYTAMLEVDRGVADCPTLPVTLRHTKI